MGIWLRFPARKIKGPIEDVRLCLEYWEASDAKA